MAGLSAAILAWLAATPTIRADEGEVPYHDLDGVAVGGGRIEAPEVHAQRQL